MAVNISPPVENSDFYLANWSTNFDAMRNEEDLYHYTDIGGLRGILSTRQLWATHTNYLNDSSEIEYGLTWISEVLKDDVKKNRELFEKDPENDRLRIYANLYSFIDEMAENYRIKLVRDNAPFVTCLSRAEDSLTQWQAYGGREGYCLKFDGEELAQSVHQANEKSGRVDPPPEITIDQVKYQTWHLYSDVNKAVSEFLQEAIDADEDWTSEDSVSFQNFAKKLNEMAMLMKNQKFWPERERRICVSGGRETFYTESRLGLIPRMRLGFSPKSLLEVMVGPGEHMEARKYSIERFLSSQRYLNHVTVSLSEVPYREP
ncbi:DUF2971 domain-containing protein [Tsukamurella tyrosinosolvens]|uniref:DUF2971 domain-containing protein n=1 Tax=Tsukamurella tyrosinosolvens TaxID=57704 RepID=UPI003F49D458